jgi:hypothetical protein
MGEKLIVGPIDKGIRTDRLPFAIDNDSFPSLFNAYQWRGRIKRKRGTALLGRLQRFFNSASTSYGVITSITLDGTGSGNLLTGFSLQTTGNIVPGSVTFTDSTTSITYTDPAKNGTLSPSGTINYATGVIDLGVGAAGDTITTVSFLYYPDLPVMGIRDLNLPGVEYPGTLAFDTMYSYNILTTAPYSIYNVSFYKNPPATGFYAYPGYIQKTVVTPTSWNGENYQQFWTVNYQGALWATNGIDVPFTVTNIGMQYKPIVTVTVTSGGPPAIVNLQIIAHGLVVGDFLFINEVVTTTGINFQTGYVIAVIDANNVTVEFPDATIATNGTGGIAQYLTNRSDPTKDCIRWYDGDPTNMNPTAPILNGNLGWVNFSPPLFSGSNIVTIGDLPYGLYYLVGARMIVPYKDYLLFIGVVVQTSTVGSQVYLQDTIVYSQNGTPYYTASFTGSVTSSATVFSPVLTPINQTATANAYFEDITGYGGNYSTGLNQPIISASPNEDTIILGYTNKQVRLIYTGDGINPFNTFIVNSEYGTSSTFSAITMDRGVLSRGNQAIVITSQIACERIDLDLPDQVFEMTLLNHGAERITAARDFINEWIYFTYVSETFNTTFPNQTLQFNYRDNSWGIFNEAYTTYGTFRQVTGDTWATIGNTFPTWADWNEPWGAGSSNLLQPKILGGNQQGFILFRDEGTSEGTSLYIENIVGGTVTSPDHTLNQGDYIIISGALGTVGPFVNGKIFSVGAAPTENTFVLDPIPATGTYLGGGVITRMYVPLIQTKQFQPSWGMGRKTRMGMQQYLLSNTFNAQIQLQIYLSQNPVGIGALAYNSGPIVPGINVVNNTLIYADTLFTCPESENLGLTPANINLQMVTANNPPNQEQIWHRLNTSLLGDTIQLGFTLSDAQMRTVDINGNPVSQFAEIELHGFVIDLQPSQLLA